VAGTGVVFHFRKSFRVSFGEIHMYLPTVFAEKDAAFIADFVDRHPLATVVISGHDGLVIDHIPFMREGELTVGHRLIAHAAKANSLWRTLDTGAPAVLVFSGAGAYVSPSLYPSKQTTHEVVPTWNYVAIHIHGRLSYTSDHLEKRAIVDRLTNKMEAARATPWRTTDAPTRYIDQMLQGVVGLVFDIDTIVAKTKASQNRLPEDRAGVLAGLANNAETSEAALVVERCML
jgi:transcriptional regulator